MLVDPNAPPDAGADGQPLCPEGLVMRESSAILTYAALAYATSSEWLPNAKDAARAAKCAQVRSPTVEDTILD